ncbi:hypothetical protein CCACVL1_28317, partial [Corchorus capsularis]
MARISSTHLLIVAALFFTVVVMAPLIDAK